MKIVSRASLFLTLTAFGLLGAAALYAVPGGQSRTHLAPATAGNRDHIVLVQARRLKRQNRAERPPDAKSIPAEPMKGLDPKGKDTEPPKNAAGNSKDVPVKDLPLTGAKPAAADAQAPAPEPDVWTEAEVAAALRECLELLAPVQAEIEVLNPIKDKQCGTPAPVLLKRLGGKAGVEISPPATINCRMVARLYDWVEGSLQPITREMFGTHVSRLSNASGYVCRNRYGSPVAKISEHAFANALDISSLKLADGRTIDLLQSWGMTRRDVAAAAEAAASAKVAAVQAAKSDATPAEVKKNEPLSDSKASKTRDGEANKKETRDVKNKKDVKDKTGTGDKFARNRQQDAGRAAPELVLEKPRNAAEAKRLAAALEKDLKGKQRKNAVADDKAIPVAPVTGDAKEALYLRRLHAGACGMFGTVLGPEANEAHRNHFHFDLAPRKRSAFCE